MQDNRIVVRRHLPNYEFLLVTSAEPIAAQRMLGDAIGLRSPRNSGDDPIIRGHVNGLRFEVQEMRHGIPIWLTSSIQGALGASVAGSNVLVSVRLSSAWWLATILSASSVVFTVWISFYLHRFVPALVPAILLFVFCLLERYRTSRRAMQLLETLLPGPAA